MGLLVTVYKNIKPCSDDDADFVAYVSYEYWRWKVKNLQYNQAYTGDVVGDVGVSYSYDHHGMFLAYLMLMAWRTDMLGLDGKIDYSKIGATDTPFFDFIDFADNEGCLDWEVAEKILGDFDNFAENASLSSDEKMRSLYSDWHDIFRAAVLEKGVIVFS